MIGIICNIRNFFNKADLFLQTQVVFSQDLPSADLGGETQDSTR